MPSSLAWNQERRAERTPSTTNIAVRTSLGPRRIVACMVPRHCNSVPSAEKSVWSVGARLRRSPPTVSTSSGPITVDSAPVSGIHDSTPLPYGASLGSVFQGPCVTRCLEC